MKPKRNFASDNNPGVHPDVMRAITAANSGHALAYGDDPCTAAAVEKFKETFGPGIEVLFVTTGTAANVVGLSVITESFNSIICSHEAHIFVDECNAVENFIGCKLVPLHTPDAKLTVDIILDNFPSTSHVHQPRPGVISITQPTELGTVYEPAEIRALSDFAHRKGMLLHMDGARLANAAVSLGKTLRGITRDCGVDVLSFGGTKNGAMLAESVVFFNARLARNASFKRKQATQLLSKMRFTAVQFGALLSNGLWEKNAANANAMAKLLAGEISKIPLLEITQKVEANAVFAKIPRRFIPGIQESFYFYEWGDRSGIARFMCSWDTTEKDVRDFAKAMRVRLRP